MERSNPLYDIMQVGSINGFRAAKEGTSYDQRKKCNSRTVIPEEVDYLYRLITDINKKGPYWHLQIPPLNKFGMNTEKVDSGPEKKGVC